MKNDNMKKKIATGILVGTSITGIASSAVLAANTTTVVDDEVTNTVRQSVQLSSDRSSSKRNNKKSDKKVFPKEVAKAPERHINTQSTSSSYVFMHRGGHYQKNLIKNKFQDFKLRGYAYPYYGYITEVTEKTFTVYINLFSVEGRLYYADGNGDIQTGLKRIGEDLYYFGDSKDNAYARKGWYIDGDIQYYFGDDGKAIKGFKKFDDILIYFNDKGERVQEIVTTMDDDIYYYPKGSTTPFTGGWKKIGKDMFYFGRDGKAVKNGSIEDGDITYNLDKYGRRTTMIGILK